MKSNIHPLQKQVLAKCVCNNEFYFFSSLEVEVIHIEVCNKCHPCATGKQQTIVVAGRAEKFNNRFNDFLNKKDTNSIIDLSSKAIKNNINVNKIAKHTKVNKKSSKDEKNHQNETNKDK